MRHQWSLEQISSRLKFGNSSFTISYNTIYREIYNGRFDEKGLSHGNRGVVRKLRHCGKSRHTKNYEERRGKIQISNLITDRPDPANNRERLGDWEADTVMGQTGKACLVTLTDRKSRYLLCKKIAKKHNLLSAQYEELGHLKVNMNEYLGRTKTEEKKESVIGKIKKCKGEEKLKPMVKKEASKEAER